MRSKLFGALFFLAIALMAQESGPAISQRYKPGDPLHYYVQFDGDPKIDRVIVEFNRLPQPPRNPDQESLTMQVSIGEKTIRISPGLFEVDGVIPNAASGSYNLTDIVAQAKDGQLAKGYTEGKDFSANITIEVVNDLKFDFPKIKSVSPNP